MANDNGSGDALALLGAMFVGAVVGAAAALLLAPKSGEELRGDIGEAAHRAKERAAEVKDSMAAKYDDLRAKIEEHIESGAHEAAEAAEELAGDVKASTERA